ncbi:MAG: RimK family alpha-L-glutamate ligase [Sumerlaeia bacterium]
MRIALLSRAPNSYSSRRLREAAEAHGHRLDMLDTLRFSLGISHHRPSLFYENKAVPNYDAVIPRIGASITFYGLAVIRQFEQMGVSVQNESLAISRSRDKLRSMQILSRHDVGIPTTAFVRAREDVLPAIARIGGAPVIIKVLEGTQGIGVILADSVKIAQAIIETLQSARQNVLIQKFIAESKGKDIRAIVVGDRVVAAMRRKAVGDEYRSNVHRGGTTEGVTLSPEYEHTAIRAAQIMGLSVAGVDMLEGETGPQVMEVNSSPGLEGIEKCTGVDVAACIIEELEHQVLFPDVDLKSRLRLTAGFGVAEFPVHNMPDIEGRKLRDTTLSADNIHVLQINRNNAILPNPGGDDLIETGDKLLCYGELAKLRALMPKRESHHET